jgi:hypothetical protein
MSSRNDPCPCGSGKKYKHCCMRSAMTEDIAGRSVLMPEKPAPTPEEIAFLAGPKCGQCAHWRQQPKQKVDVAAMKRSEAFKAAPAEQQRAILEQARLHNMGASLNEERLGECRLNLLTLPITGQAPGQPPQLQGTISYYPQNVPADFRACGQFKARPETAEEAKQRAARVLQV